MFAVLPCEYLHPQYLTKYADVTIYFMIPVSIPRQRIPQAGLRYKKFVSDFNERTNTVQYLKLPTNQMNTGS